MEREQEQGRIHIFFSHVSTWIAKRTGSLFVVSGLSSSFGVEIANIAILIV